MWSRQIRRQVMAGADRKRKKKIKNPALLLIAGMTILAVSLGGLSAKYAYQKAKENDMAAGQFYFTSDLLDENGKTYTLPAGTTEISIELRNYEDDLRWADMDIGYSCTIQKDDDQQAKTQNNTLKQDSAKKTAATIRFEELSSGTYTVTAETKKPFQKTLKGTFKISDQQDAVSYSVNDNQGSAYAQLTVSTWDYSGAVKISWPEGLIPDTTQEAFSGVKTRENDKYTQGEVTVQMGRYSSSVYRFFKADTGATYDTSGIKAEKVEGK